MTRQLATMITSGMTLLRAFYVLEDQIENKKLKETVGAVREDIESGLAFSDALAKHPKIFSPLYVAMVRAGETGGVLEAVAGPRSPTSSRRTTSCAARSRARWPTRSSCSRSRCAC